MAIQARERTRPGLPNFSFNIVPHLNEAQFDNITIKFRGGAIAYSSRDELNGYWRLLDDRTRFLVPHLSRGHSLQSARNLIPFLKFRHGRTTRLQVAGLDVAALTAELNVSFARLLAHYPPNEDNRDAWTDGYPRSEERLAELAVRSLDGSDNYLTAPQWSATRPFLPHVVSRLRDVLRFAYTSLHGAAGDEHVLATEGGDTDMGDVALFGRRIAEAVRLGDPGVMLHLPWTDWVLSRCEVFWEYRVPDAITLIHSLRPLLFSASRDATVIDYGFPPPQQLDGPERGRWRQIRNSVSVTVRGGHDGISITAYAKQYNRIRFEVRYRGNVRQMFSSHATTSQIPATVDGLSTMLSFLQTDAQGRLSRLFSNLPGRSELSADRLNSYARFISAVAQACGSNVGQTQRMLRLLALNQGISLAGEPELANLVSQLVRARILVRSRIHRRPPDVRYVLTPEYLDVVLDALRGVDRQLFR